MFRTIYYRWRLKRLEREERRLLNTLAPYWPTGFDSVVFDRTMSLERYPQYSIAFGPHADWNPITARADTRAAIRLYQTRIKLRHIRAWLAEYESPNAPRLGKSPLPAARLLKS